MQGPVFLGWFFYVVNCSSLLYYVASHTSTAVILLSWYNISNLFCALLLMIYSAFNRGSFDSRHYFLKYFRFLNTNYETNNPCRFYYCRMPVAGL